MKNRIALWDNLKFFLITLVVVGHFAEVFLAESDIYKSIFLFIYAFHMPLFIYISGHFYSEKNLVSKCLFYISAGFLLKIVFFFCRVLNQTGLKFSLLSDDGIPWFLFALAVYTMLTHLIRNQNKKYLLVAGIVLACFVGYDHAVGDYLYLSRIVVFFPFYLAGTMAKEETIVRLKSNRWVIAGSVVILLVWLYLSFMHLDTFYRYCHLFSGRNPFSADVEAYGPLARLMCYMISALVSLAFIVLMPGRKIKALTKMGARSMDVFFWHWPVYTVLNHFFHINGLFSLGRYGKAAFLLLAVLLSVVLSLGGVISWPLNQLKRLCYHQPKKPQEAGNVDAPDQAQASEQS